MHNFDKKIQINDKLKIWIEASSHFKKEDIITYDDIFEEQRVLAIKALLGRAQWRYGHFSSSQYANSPPFWSMTLIEDKLFTEILLNKINEITGVEHDLLTVYANGQTYGQSGMPHIDNHEPDCRTFLWYASPWDVRWNGKTCFYVEGGNHFVVPKFNSAVYFSSMIPHFAEETTRTFGGLRQTVAWKLRVK